MKKTASRFLAMILALCLAVSLMPSALAREEVAAPDAQDFELELELQYTSNGEYQARYKAKLKVSDPFAKAVAVYPDKHEVLDDLIFTCLLKGELIDLMDGNETLNFIFSSPGDVFQPTEGYKGEGDVLTAKLEKIDGKNTVKAEFELNPETVETWNLESAEAVKTALQVPVTVTSNWMTVDIETVKSAAGDDGLIHSEGQADISRKSGDDVPLYGQNKVVGAATAKHDTEVLLGNLHLDIMRDSAAVGTVSTVTVVLTEGGKEYTFPAKADEKGGWTCDIEGLPYGVYTVTVTATMEDGTTVQCVKECTVDEPNVTVQVELPATYLSTEVNGSAKPAVENLENAIPDSEKEEDIIPPQEDENYARVVDIELKANTLTEDSVIQDNDMGTTSAKVVMDSINNAGKGYELYGDGFTDFVDVVITKHVTEWGKEAEGAWEKINTVDNPVHNTPGLITMSFPISQNLRTAIAEADAAKEEGEPEITNENILVFRRHGSDIQPMRKVSASAGPGANYECYYISTVGGENSSGAEYITVKANQFSVYAFGVSTLPVGEYSPESYYYVTFESNGGSRVYTRGVVRGGTLNLENIVPQREGYIFTGWYTDPELTNRVTSVKPDKNMKLYAGWQKDMADPNDTGVAVLLNTDSHFSYVQGVPGGLFTPSAKITRKEAAQIFFNLLRDQTPVAPKFSDVPADEWYADAVGTLADLGILLGTGGDKFEPDRPITRAEFTTIAMRFASQNPGGENIFPDLEEGSWYYDHVIGAVAYGWIVGKDNGTFDPAGLLCRAEAVTIVNRMLRRFGDRNYIDSHTDEIVTYPDTPSTYWAYYDIEEASNTHDFTRDVSVETWVK